MSASTYKTLGIASALLMRGEMNDETEDLISAAEEQYGEVIILNALDMSYAFERMQSRPVIWHQETDISDLSALIIRGTGEYPSAFTLMAHGLELCGCVGLDPVRRFSPGKAGKVFTTIERYKTRVGTDSYFSLSHSASTHLLRWLHEVDAYPLIAKPVSGRGGVGVTVLKDIDASFTYLKTFVATRDSDDEPLYLQRFMPFVKEYRVMLLDGHIVTMAEKSMPSQGQARNAQQGARFTRAHDDDVAAFVASYAPAEGLVGVDVARTENGELHLIESNRAPCWQELQSATGANIGEQIVKHLAGKENMKSEGSCHEAM